LNSLSRQQASLILQLRCGHFPLNGYLHRIKKVESDRCERRSVQGRSGRPHFRNCQPFHFRLPSTHQGEERVSRKNRAGPLQFTRSNVYSHPLKSVNYFH
jgi:hypothetical protein